MRGKKRNNLLLLIFQERDELVRKGILTPFHKLKGFERRFQQPEASTSHNAAEEDNTIDLASAGVERAAKLISEAARARPATKLLDSEALPKLDIPTYPFRRLRKPLKLPPSLESDEDKNKVLKRRKRRPLPDRKWTNRVSREEKQLEGSGMSNVLIA